MADTIENEQDDAPRGARTSTDAEALKTSLGIHTVADLADKDASAIAGAFGGDLNKAKAVIAGVKAGLGMIRR